MEPNLIGELNQEITSNSNFNINNLINDLKSYDLDDSNIENESKSSDSSDSIIKRKIDEKYENTSNIWEIYNLTNNINDVSRLSNLPNNKRNSAVYNIKNNFKLNIDNEDMKKIDSYLADSTNINNIKKKLQKDIKLQNLGLDNIINNIKPGDKINNILNEIDKKLDIHAYGNNLAASIKIIEERNKKIKNYIIASVKNSLRGGELLPGISGGKLYKLYN